MAVSESYLLQKQLPQLKMRTLTLMRVFKLEVPQARNKLLTSYKGLRGLLSVVAADRGTVPKGG